MSKNPMNKIKKDDLAFRGKCIALRNALGKLSINDIYTIENTVDKDLHLYDLYSFLMTVGK